MQNQVFCGKIMPVKDGWLACPTCRRNKRLLKIDSDTRAEALPVFCRDCKTQYKIDIDRGQCFESRSH